ERAVLDVLFQTAGDTRFEHRTPDRVYDLGRFSIRGSSPVGAAGSFETLRVDPELSAEHESIQHDIEREPDKVLALFSRMPLLYGDRNAVASSYACPMHPEVTDSEPSTCPKCGMNLVAVEAPSATSYACPMHPEVTASEPGTCPKCGMKLVPVEAAEPTSFVCPMHPEVTASEPGTCPKCGMKLVPADASSAAAPDTSRDVPLEHGGHEHGDGLEWEDLM